MPHCVASPLVFNRLQVGQAIVGLILMGGKFSQLNLKGKIMSKNKNFITVSIPLSTYHVLKDMAEKNERKCCETINMARETGNYGRKYRRWCPRARYI